MIKGTFLHNEIAVLDLEKSMDFYEKALGLTEKRRKVSEGNFILVFLWDGHSDYELELTWYNNREKPFDLGDNEAHMAFEVESAKEAYRFHKEMGVVIYENRGMNLYFIGDPDGNWIEILGKDRNEKIFED